MPDLLTYLFMTLPCRVIQAKEKNSGQEGGNKDVPELLCLNVDFHAQHVVCCCSFPLQVNRTFLFGVVHKQLTNGGGKSREVQCIVPFFSYTTSIP